MTRALERPLTLAVVGCGTVVERYHVPALKQCPEWKVIGACDPLRDRRQWMRREFAQAHVFESFAELVAQCPADAALIATPPSMHCELTLRALQAGIHVLVEKPMALRTVDAEEMWRTALRVRKRIAVGFSRRFSCSYLELRRRLARLEARQLRSIRFDLVGNAEAWQAVSGFLGDDARGGGALDDLGSHQLDLLPWLLDQRVQRVKATRHSRDGERWQRIAYELEFESGLVGACSVGHGPNGSERLQVDTHDRRLVAHAGRVIELRHHPTALPRAYRLLQRMIGLRRKREDVVTPFARQLRSFALAASNGGTHADIADASSGLAAVQLVEACRDSMRLGGDWIAIEPRGA